MQLKETESKEGLDIQQDEEKFEQAIDSFREGYIDKLGEYFNYVLPKPTKNWFLSSSGWKEEIIPVIEYYEQHSGNTYLRPDINRHNYRY